MTTNSVVKKMFAQQTWIESEETNTSRNCVRCKCLETNNFVQLKVKLESVSVT